MTFEYRLITLVTLFCISKVFITSYCLFRIKVRKDKSLSLQLYSALFMICVLS